MAIELSTIFYTTRFAICRAIDAIESVNLFSNMDRLKVVRNAI